MSERFKIGLDLITIEDTSKEYGALNQDEVVNELNRLNKENKQLKQRINVLDDQITAQGIVIEGYQNRNQKLFDEKEQLKEKNEFAKLLANHRGEMVSFADSLIQDIDDELTQKMWHQFKEEMYQKWKKKRRIE